MPRQSKLERKKPLPRAATIDTEEPDDSLDTRRSTDTNTRTRAKAARFVIEFFRRRVYESKAKLELRKKLRRERNKLIKTKNKLAKKKNDT